MVWAAVFAAYWRSPGPSREIGHVTPGRIARAAARAASSALVELRDLAGSSADGEVDPDVLADARALMNAEDAP
jgi:hypothetical protein